MQTGQAVPAEPYAVLDETGKVREWLDKGRGLRVWVSHDLGAGRPDILTPGDVERAPHWAYPLSASRVIAPADIVFFHRMTVAKEWSDTRQGWKAAERYVDQTSKLADRIRREAPIGTVLSRFTVERLQYQTTTKVRMEPPDGPAYDRPLASRFVVAVVEWTAILPKVDDTEPQPREPR